MIPDLLSPRGHHDWPYKPTIRSCEAASFPVTAFFLQKPLAARVDYDTATRWDSLNWRRLRARRARRQLALLDVQMPIAADRHLRHGDGTDLAGELGRRVSLVAAE